MAGHPFGLEWYDDAGPFDMLVVAAERTALFEYDESFGHHGKPAKYGAAAEGGVIHPWRQESDDEEEDLAMLTIMESTPEMCPLCAQEGHSIGHDEHKKVLAKLRQKMLQSTTNKNNKKEKVCPLCKAAGSEKDHGKHAELMKEAKSCPLCRAEGHIHNHGDHRKAAEASGCLECQAMGHTHDHASHKCPLCKAEGSSANHGHHQLLMTLAESISLLDRLDNFDADDDGLDGMMDFARTVTADKMPIRDFSLRAGQPKDEPINDDDEGDSLFGRIIKNIKDLLGLGPSTSEDGENVGGTVAVIILLFVGTTLLSLGIVEMLSAFLDGQQQQQYEGLPDDDDRMFLDMEEQKGAIQL